MNRAAPASTPIAGVQKLPESAAWRVAEIAGSDLES
jgi:hypothetical protein